MGSRRAESTDTNAVCSSKNGKDREHGAQQGAARATLLVQWAVEYVQTEFCGC